MSIDSNRLQIYAIGGPYITLIAQTYESCGPAGPRKPWRTSCPQHRKHTMFSWSSALRWEMWREVKRSLAAFPIKAFINGDRGMDLLLSTCMYQLCPMCHAHVISIYKEQGGDQDQNARCDEQEHQLHLYHFVFHAVVI